MSVCFVMGRIFGTFESDRFEYPFLNTAGVAVMF